MAGTDTARAAYWRGDYATALKVWRPLADHGNAVAQFGLGMMYEHGDGVPRDFVQALGWYLKAADRGQAAAQYELAEMYERGEGAPQNYVLAHMWYSLTISRAKTASTRDRAVKARNQIALKMAPAQILEAQRMARERGPK